MIALCAPIVAATLSITGVAELEKRPVKVTLLVILADSSKQHVDPKLKTLAAEVRKREPGLTRFEIHATLAKSLLNEQSHDFQVLNDQTCRVRIHQPRDPTGRVRLTITPPGLAHIKLECVCGRYLPIVTPKLDEEGRRLILAIMASPCLGK